MILRIKKKNFFSNLKNPIQNLIFVFKKNSNDYENIEKNIFFLV
jgi:hypothetical protein